MIFEIATPYDIRNAKDIHTNLASLFTALATLAGDGDPAATQYEVWVYRFDSWERREEAISNPEEGGGEQLPSSLCPPPDTRERRHGMKYYRQPNYCCGGRNYLVVVEGQIVRGFSPSCLGLFEVGPDRLPHFDSTRAQEIQEEEYLLALMDDGL